MCQKDIAPNGFGTPVAANDSTDYAIPAATFTEYPEPLWFPEDGGSIFLLMFLQCVVLKKAVVW